VVRVPCLPVSLPGDHPIDRPDLSDRDPMAALHRWIAEARVDDAAARRAKQRWLEDQAGDTATVAGVLLDLGERELTVQVTTAAGRHVRGVVAGLGADFVTFRDARGVLAVVPLRAVALVRPGPGVRAATGDRMPGLDAAFSEALAAFAVERPDVTVHAAGDDVHGRLVAAGIDVLTVRLDGASHDVVHVATGTVDHLVMR